MHGVHFESTRAPRPNSFQTTLAGHYLWNIKMQDPAFSGSETVEHDRQRPACRPDQMVLAAETGSHRGQCAQFRCHPDRGGYRPYNRKGVAMTKRRTLGEHQTRHARQHVILACSATSHASHWTPNLTDRQTKNIRVACASPSEELACTATGRMSDEESLAAKAW